jgi:putative ABC transport system permease protein
VVNAGGEPVPASVQEQLAAVDGVLAATGLTGASVTGPDGQETRVSGVSPEQALPVLRSTAHLTVPEQGQIVLPFWAEDSWHAKPGSSVTLTAGDRSRTLSVVAGKTEYPLLTAVDLQGLSPGAAVDTMWLRLADDADQTAAIDEITDLTGSAVPTAVVTGLASERAAIDSVLDVLLLIVTGLLGVAVVIALIGVGNTLALSVVERRQESGLLRALGLTRGQLRGLLAWEAVLVAGVAALLGVLLGGIYGLVGAASVLGDLGEIVLSVPWLQVGAIVAVATVAGLLASVLPARRAARTPPVAAIAG